jgi:hypothetical protein
MNFIKLKNQFSFTEDDVKEQAGSQLIGNQVIRIFPIDLSDEKIQEIYKLIPDYARNSFSISGVKISGQLPPHIDDAKTSILIYVDTGGFKTQFYKFNNTTPEIVYRSTLKGADAGISKDAYKPETYKLSDLTEDDYYIANKHDAYCVDGNSIHSIMTSNNRPINRSFILVTFADTSFDSVVSLLKETNSI